MLRSKRIFFYILSELLPSFVLGMLIFLMLVVMGQAVRYTEFYLVHGVSLVTILQIMGFISISFLPALFPMSVLFSVLFAYSRLSNDSEILAMKAAGYPLYKIAAPALLLGIVVTIVSAETTFRLGPWGNRQFEIVVSELGSTRAGISLREGTFAGDFFDMVIYANKVDSRTGEMEQVFIFDERQKGSPMTIIARRGQLIQDPDKPGHEALLRLNEGDIHRQAEAHTKIRFDTYDIELHEPYELRIREKSPASMTIAEISKNMTQHNKNDRRLWTLQAEFHKRWALPMVSFIFALLGFVLGTQSHRRAARSGGLALCLVIIVSYWIIFIAAESAVRNGTLPAALALWVPNALFFIPACWAFLRMSRQ